MDIDFTYYIYKTDDTVYMYSIDYSSNEIIEDITNNGGNMAEQVLKTTNDSLRKKIAENKHSTEPCKRFCFWLCAGHGMSSVGDKPTTGSYRQV